MSSGTTCGASSGTWKTWMKQLISFLWFFGDVGCGSWLVLNSQAPVLASSYFLQKGLFGIEFCIYVGFSQTANEKLRQASAAKGFSFCLFIFLLTRYILRLCSGKSIVLYEFGFLCSQSYSRLAFRNTLFPLCSSEHSLLKALCSIREPKKHRRETSHWCMYCTVHSCHACFSLQGFILCKYNFGRRHGIVAAW